MSVSLVVALAFNIAATFVHAGEEVPLFGFVAGGIAALLFARLVFLALPGERWWRGLAGVWVFLAMLPLLTIGTAFVVYDVAEGKAGTAFVAPLVALEGLYLSVVPEPAQYWNRHRNDNLFYARFVRALHSCDERRVMQALEEAMAGHGGQLYGRTDLFSRRALARFIDEEWCSEELRRYVQDRAKAWLDQVRLS